MADKPLFLTGVSSERPGK